MTVDSASELIAAGATPTATGRASPSRRRPARGVGRQTAAAAARQAEGTLRRLHETALLLFAERGFHAVSVRDLTGSLGMQPSSLYAHLPSKQHLLGDLIRIGHEEHRDPLRLACSRPATTRRPDRGAHPRTRADPRDLSAAHPAVQPRARRRCSTRTSRTRSSRSVPTPTGCSSTSSSAASGSAPSRRSTRCSPSAAIGAMGIRVAEWWRPDVGVSIEEVAETYATFAVRMVS